MSESLGPGETPFPLLRRAPGAQSPSPASPEAGRPHPCTQAAQRCGRAAAASGLRGSAPTGTATSTQSRRIDPSSQGQRTFLDSDKVSSLPDPSAETRQSRGDSAPSPARFLCLRTEHHELGSRDHLNVSSVTGSSSPRSLPEAVGPSPVGAAPSFCPAPAVPTSRTVCRHTPTAARQAGGPDLPGGHALCRHDTLPSAQAPQPVFQAPEPVQGDGTKEHHRPDEEKCPMHAQPAAPGGRHVLIPGLPWDDLAVTSSHSNQVSGLPCGAGWGGTQTRGESDEPDTGGTGKAASRACKLQGELDTPDVLGPTCRAQGASRSIWPRAKFSMILRFCENFFLSSLTGTTREETLEDLTLRVTTATILGPGGAQKREGETPLESSGLGGALRAQPLWGRPAGRSCCCPGYGAAPLPARRGRCCPSCPGRRARPPLLRTRRKLPVATRQLIFNPW